MEINGSLLYVEKRYLKTLVNLAHIVCSTDYILMEEEHSFTAINGCPKLIFKQTLDVFERPRVIKKVANDSHEKWVHISKFIFKGKQNDKLINSISNTVFRTLSKNQVTIFWLELNQALSLTNINMTLFILQSIYILIVKRYILGEKLQD